MADVVYKPISLDTTSIIDTPKEIDKPDYPDRGVSYAGYSKTPRSGNSYELNPQIEADINFNYSFNGIETNLDLNRVNQDTKDFYCKHIFITYKNNGSAVAVNDIINLTAGIGGTNFLTFNEDPAAYWILDLELDTPLLFPKGKTITLNFSRVRALNENISVNYYGWEE